MNASTPNEEKMIIGCGNERERHAERHDEQQGQPLRREGGQQEGEAQVAGDHDDGADHEHRGALAAEVEQRSEEGGEHHGQDGEAAEEACRRFGVDAERHLEEVGRIALEGEDGRVVEYAEQRHEPEHLAAEDVFEVADVELLVGGFLLLELPGCDELPVELAVHVDEYGVAEQADDQQYGAEGHGGYDRLVEVVRDHRGEPHDGEDAQWPSQDPWPGPSPCS